MLRTMLGFDASSKCEFESSHPVPNRWVGRMYVSCLDHVALKPPSESKCFISSANKGWCLEAKKNKSKQDARRSSTF